MSENTVNEESNGNEHTDNNTIDLIRLAIPFLLHGLSQGFEGRSIVSLSVQLSPDGTYQGIIKSVIDLGEPTESGYVAYTRADHASEVLEYFEYCLAFDDFKWKVDKYHKNAPKVSKIARKTAGKRTLG